MVLEEVEGDGSGIHFLAVSSQRAIDGVIKDKRFEVLERPQRYLKLFLVALIGTLKSWMDKAFIQRHVICYWVSGQVECNHPIKEIMNMDPS